MRYLVHVLGVSALVIGLAACSKGAEEAPAAKTAPAKAAPAAKAATSQPAAAAESEPVAAAAPAEASDEEIAVPADFEDEVEKEITADNYAAALDAIEADLEAE